jgi:uncharacterized membrane protein required for colicin V production
VWKTPFLELGCKFISRIKGYFFGKLVLRVVVFINLIHCVLLCLHEMPSESYKETIEIVVVLVR